MKRLFLSLFSSFLFFGAAAGMENNLSTHVSSNSQITYKPNSSSYKSIHCCYIYAIIPNQPVMHCGEMGIVGAITYSFDTKEKKGKISSILINKNFRQNHIGFELFQQAILDTIERCPGITEINWHAVPERGLMSIDTLCDIYQKMVNKLGNGFELLWGKTSENARSMTLKIIPNNGGYA